MTAPARVRCAVYTRKSSEEGLEQSFNSLHAQREACEAYILSQRHEGWQLVTSEYDDGGFSGGSMERPALKKLLEDIAAKMIDTVVVYKVDRLTRSLTDFSRIVDQFDRQGISFVSVTQQFNTTTSMGRLTLNVLLSFAQFEREVTGERIRDKIAASKKKGMWMGGVVPVGYDLNNHQLTVNAKEAERVRQIYQLYLKVGCVSHLREHLTASGIRSKERVSRTGRASGGAIYSRGSLYEMLRNRIYLGEINHKGTSYPGKQAAIVDQELWDRVQAQLKANLQAPRKRSRVNVQGLLTGIVFDVQGTRFTPSHTNKKGRRYCYYVSQEVIRKAGEKQPGPTRYPAEELEGLVVNELRSLLNSSQRLIEIVCGTVPTEPELLRSVSADLSKWASVSVDRVRTAFREVVQRVVLGQESIEIEVNRDALRHLILTSEQRTVRSNDETGIFMLSVSAKLKRCGGEVRLLLPSDQTGDRAKAVPSLVRAIARAHDWVDQIVSGQVLNQRSIAELTGFDERYVSRLLPLAFLSPSIVEAILEGKQAAHIDLDTCAGGMPASWAEQESRLTRVT